MFGTRQQKNSRLILSEPGLPREQVLVINAYRKSRINYLWSDEKRGFCAAPEVVARDQLRGQGQNVIGASMGAELMRVHHLTA